LVADRGMVVLEGLSACCAIAPGADNSITNTAELNFMRWRQ
jgi:hypothetical protein